MVNRYQVIYRRGLFEPLTERIPRSGGLGRMAEANHHLLARPTEANPALTRPPGAARDSETSGQEEEQEKYGEKDVLMHGRLGLEERVHRTRQKKNPYFYVKNTFIKFFIGSI